MVVKDAGATYDPFGFALLRFTVAAAALSPFLAPACKDKRIMAAGLELGLWTAAGGWRADRRAGGRVGRTRCCAAVRPCPACPPAPPPMLSAAYLQTAALLPACPLACPLACPPRDAHPRAAAPQATLPSRWAC